jgi:glycosyltransferase involved in cell wall biosynthesis
LKARTKTYNVLLLINVRWWNASAFYAVNIARLLHKHGHRVWVGCDPEYPAYQMAKAHGLRVAPLAFYGSNPIKLFRSFHRLIRLVRREGIQIINSHRSEDHNFGLLAKYICGTSCVITRGDQRRIRRYFLSSLRYQLADAVILTCHKLLSDNKKVFINRMQRVHVIHGSVDEEHFVPRSTYRHTASKYGLPTDKIIVGMVGRLSWVKDQPRFVEVAISLAHCRNDLHFLVAGKDVDLKQVDLRQRTIGSGVADQFTFISQVDDIADLINIVDVGVIGSVASETISRVLLELMYLGKPVVATNVNAIGEIVVPGFTGESVPAGDSGALMRGIVKLADHPELRIAYGQNASRNYNSQYSENQFYKSYLDVFSHL